MVTIFEKLQLRRERFRKKIEEIDLLLSLLQKHDVDGDEDDDEDDDIKATVPMTQGSVISNTVRVRRRAFDFGDDPPKTERPTRNLPKALMSQVVKQILHERRKPMTRTDIVEALELKGIPVAGADRNKAIGTIMWRMRDEFVNLQGWGYWLASEDFPQAAYKAPTGAENDDDETKPQTALALDKPSVFE